ncbi:MAG: TlpA disulfide reductase family protein [Bacteroidota bacterium]
MLRFLILGMLLLPSFALFSQKIVIEYDESGTLEYVPAGQSRIGHQGQAVGWEMPTTEWVDVEGNAISTEDWEGKTVVLNFWWVGCTGCAQEEPYLAQLTERYAENEDVLFVSICASKPGKIRRYLKEHENWGYRIISSNFKAVAENYKVRTTPTHWIVRDGKLSQSVIGVIRNEEVLDWFVAQIGE